jgi:hypothetical protein
MTSNFPKELLSEAAAYAGGWVYEIDARYDPNGEVPFNAIVRAWKIAADGKPTGEVWENPEYDPRSLMP